jgi:hypothetical protein
MRWRIICANGAIVIVLTLLTYFLLKTGIERVVDNPSEQRHRLDRALRSASAQLALDALVFERWLGKEADSEAVRAVFLAGTAEARQEAATREANRLRDAAVARAEFARMTPSLLLFVDAAGTALGRNGTEAMRGDEVSRVYPALARVLARGETESDVWNNGKRQERMLTTYAPVKARDGKVLGALVLGTPLSDERMMLTSEQSSGESLALVSGQGEVLASGGPAARGFDSEEVRAAIRGASSGMLSHAAVPVLGQRFAALPLAEYSSGDLFVVAAVAGSPGNDAHSVLWPVLAVGGLGLFLVVVAGIMLGNYVSRPIAELEEGLLLIINGQRDLRFDLEHAELGGLTSRVNALLGSLLGVPEDQRSD